MLKKYALLFSILSGFLTSSLSAQESMMPDVSFVQLEKLISTSKENYPKIKALESSIKLAKSRQEVQIAKYTLDEYNLTLETEVKKRYFAYIQAINKLKIHSKISEDALSVSRVAKSRYGKSEISFEEFSNSQITVSNAILSKIDAESNFLTAKALLEELLTKRIEEVQ